VPHLTSDPDAWLRGIYTRLAKQPGFGQLAAASQSQQLLNAVAVEYPRQAALMRQYDEPARRATLLHLRNMTELKPLAREVELWQARKGKRELRCTAVYLPHGIDLRVFDGPNVRRTEQLKDGRTASDHAAEWLARLRGHGWVVDHKISQERGK
jgi:hypothetical protein